MSDRLAKIIGFLTIFAAWFVYYINFDKGSGFSESKGDWGTFGDFVGGVSNPIITFITMCMLIRSINLQKEANDSLLEQNKNLQVDAERQREIDDLRSFETSFYSLSEVARSEYLSIKLIEHESIYSSAEAVSFAEHSLIEKAKSENLCEVFDYLNKISSFSIYSAVRSFYVLFKLTQDSCPEKYKERYFEICAFTMPVKFLHLVCLCKVFTDWKVVKNLADLGFFDKAGLDVYIQSFEEVKKVASSA